MQPIHEDEGNQVMNEIIVGVLSSTLTAVLVLLGLGFMQRSKPPVSTETPPSWRPSPTCEHCGHVGKDGLRVVYTMVTPTNNDVYMVQLMEASGGIIDIVALRCQRCNRIELLAEKPPDFPRPRRPQPTVPPTRYANPYEQPRSSAAQRGNAPWVRPPFDNG